MTRPPSKAAWAISGRGGGGVRGGRFRTPGWTSYNPRFQYQTYGVTNLLNGGHNAMGAVLGDGWYRGVVGFAGAHDHYGDRLALLCQIDVTYGAGHGQILGP